jgi:hypothetical protein
MDECYHYHRETDKATDKVYCRECKVFLDVEKYWWGNIKIGKMETSFEAPGKLLDLKWLIEDTMGNKVSVGSVQLLNDERWMPKYIVLFGLGSSQFSATVVANSGEKFLPTNYYYNPPEDEAVAV